MSIAASEWVDVMKTRKIIFEMFRKPNSVQAIVDKTGMTYGTINHHLKKLLNEYIAKDGYEIAGLKRKRDLYITIKDDFNPEMPDYVKEYLGSEAKRADLLNSAQDVKPADDGLLWTELSTNHRRISSDRYHTRGHTEKRSAWNASSLQGF